MLYNFYNPGKSNIELAYTDVTEDSPWANAVKWALEAGVIRGITDKTFAPDKKITRLEMIVMLARFDEERENIMPVAKTYKITQILDACNNYFDKTGRRYIFEYVLIQGENDTKRHAEGLINLLKGRPCHVNLIRLNEVKENSLKSATDKDAYRFLGFLEKAGLSATVRRRMGEDIDGACGQLRQRYLEENK
jgi:23S rRNA (adenine2503-C2)-methyltransferase